MDVTETKQMGDELRRHRAELTHVSRVASLGQLTTAFTVSSLRSRGSSAATFLWRPVCEVVKG